MQFPVLHIDVESRSTCELKTAGMYRYWEDPTTDVWMAAWAIDDEPVELWRPGDKVPDRLRRHIQSNFIVFAHNAGFERLCFQHCLGPRYGFPIPALESFRCTAAMAAAMSLPRDLDGAAMAVGLDVRKDAAGKRLMISMAKPRRVENGTLIWWDTPDRIERLAAYCINDVVVERQLEKRLRPLDDAELEIWRLDQVINERGVQVDLKAVAHAKAIVAKELDALDKELSQVTRHAVTSATQVFALKDWLASKGRHFESLSKNIIAEKLENMDDDADPDVRRVLEIRREAGKSSVAKLEAFSARASADGRARENLMYHGASTGRWSGRGIQLQNLPRPELNEEELHQCFDMLRHRSPDTYRLLYGSVLPVISSMLRGFVIAPPGKVLIRADFSNIEGRALAWLAGEKWKLNAFKDYDAGTGDDLYKITAGSILGKPAKAVTKDERQAYGKVPELALGFQGGVGAFQSMASIYRVQVTDDQAEAIKRAWRDRHPSIVQFWYALEEAAMQAVANPGRAWKVNKCTFAMKGNVLWLRLPSRRLLAYVDPQIRDVETPWGETKAAVTYMGVDQKTRQWTRQKAYGGFWAENVTQATARDVMASAMLRMEANGYPTVLTVHDEVVCETTPDRADVAEFERLMCVLPEWAEGLPVAAEGAVGARYGK